MDRWEKLYVAYILLLGGLIISQLTPGIFASDEATYLLMVKNFVERGQYDIWNGYDDWKGDKEWPVGLWMHATEFVWTGDQVVLMGVPAQFYIFFAAPFYKLFWVWGLNFMNSIAFMLSLWVTYKISQFFLSQKHAILTGVLYSISYNLPFSQMLWPHQLSTLLVIGSLYFLIYSIKKNSDGALFLSGLMIGLSIGIRFTNGLFALAHILLLFYTQKDKLPQYMTGLLICGFALAFLNFQMFGDVFETSYGSLWGKDTVFEEIFTHKIILFLGVEDPNLASVVTYAFLSIPLVTLIVFMQYLRHKKVSLNETLLKNITIAGIFCILLMVFFSPTREILQIAGSKLISMNLHIRGEGLYKKALFQSMPYISLAFFAPYFLLKRRVEKSLILLLIAHSTLLVFLYSFNSMHGGNSEVYGMRYFLESLPVIILLSVYSLKSLIKTVTRQQAAYSTVSSVIMGGILLSEGDRLYDNQGIFHWFPIMLFLSVLITAIVLFKKNSLKTAFIVFTALAIVYSGCIGYSDYFVMKTLKADVWQMSETVDASIPNDSVIFYSRKDKFPYYLQTWMTKKPRMVFTYRETDSGIKSIMNKYHERGIPMYLDIYLEANWSAYMGQLAKENNISDLRTLTFTEGV